MQNLSKSVAQSAGRSIKPRIFAFALSMLLLSLVLCTAISATVYSGKALDEEYISKQVGQSDMEGEIAKNYQIQYELDTETGVLRIWCREDYYPQKMLMYSYADWVPWIRDAVQRNAIRVVYIEEGVESVGQYAFRGCKTVEEIWLPSTVWRVDRLSISECASLKTIYYPGTKDDFEKGVIWSNDHNDYTDKAANEVITAKSLVHFGEHVTVRCFTEDGYEFKTYTVGGYFAGDSYTVEPKTYNGLTLVSDAAPISGTFAENDKTEYFFTYRCDHHFVHYEDKPCADSCEYCGLPAEDAVPHSWDVKVISERGLFRQYQARQICEVCGKVEDVTKPALILPVGIGAGVGVAVLAIVLVAVNVRLSRKRKAQKAQSKGEDLT